MGNVEEMRDEKVVVRKERTENGSSCFLRCQLDGALEPETGSASALVDRPLSPLRFLRASIIIVHCRIEPYPLHLACAPISSKLSQSRSTDPPSDLPRPSSLPPTPAASLSRHRSKPKRERSTRRRSLPELPTSSSNPSARISGRRSTHPSPRLSAASGRSRDVSSLTRAVECC
jgi:hypothetical protein